MAIHIRKSYAIINSKKKQDKEDVFRTIMLPSGRCVHLMNREIFERAVDKADKGLIIKRDI